MNWRRPALLAVAATGLLWLSLHAQISRNIRTKNFAFPEFYENTISPNNPTNRMKLLLRGAMGQYLSNDLVALTTARLEYYPPSGKGTNLVAVTPFCLLNSSAHTVSSTGGIHIVASDGAITLQGDTGFHVDMTNQVLYISNRSRTVILHGLSEKSTP